MGTAAYGGKGFKGRAAVSGDWPSGAASCRRQHTQASCQTPPGGGNCAPSPLDVDRKEKLAVVESFWGGNKPQLETLIPATV